MTSPVEAPVDSRALDTAVFCTRKGRDSIDAEPDRVLRDAQAATYAADGYVRSADEPAVVVTRGLDEALEAASGLVTSRGDKLPVVAINVMDPDDYSTLDGPGRQTAVKRITLDEEPAPGELEFPAPLARLGGPLQVSCAPTVDVTAVLACLSEAANAASGEPGAAGSTDVDESLLERIVGFDQPVILLGRGGLRAMEPAALRAASRRLDAPVLLTAGATAGPVEPLRALREAFTEDGLLPSGNLVWVRAMLSADAVVALGAGLSEADWFGMTDLGLARGPVYQVTTEEDPVDVGQTVVPAEAARFVDRLLEHSSGKQRSGDRLAHWAEQGTGWRDHLDDEADRCRDYDHIEPRLAIREIVDHAPDDAVFLGEGGSNGMWLWSALWLEPLLFPAQHATIGATLPMALGAHEVFPDRPLWCVIGDGAFFYHAEELQTAAETGVPLVVFVFNDHAWSSIRLAQTYMLGTRYVGTDLPERVDYADHAALLGCESRSARTPDELIDALGAAADYKGERPLVVNVDMKKDHVPFHGANFVLAELDGTLTSLIGPSALSFPKALWKGSTNWDTLRSVLGALWPR